MNGTSRLEKKVQFARFVHLQRVVKNLIHTTFFFGPNVAWTAGGISSPKSKSYRRKNKLNVIASTNPCGSIVSFARPVPSDECLHAKAANSSTRELSRCRQQWIRLQSHWLRSSPSKTTENSNVNTNVYVELTNASSSTVSSIFGETIHTAH